MNELFFLTRFERCVMQSVLFRCCMVDVRGGSHRLPTEDAVDARCWWHRKTNRHERIAKTDAWIKAQA